MINQNVTEEKDLKLQILSPLNKQTDERIKKYLKHIKDAFDNVEVKNLALTGVYGSGKSTIIKSFKALYPEINILDISLASFKETEDYEKFKDHIQLNILQQIIYSQKADKIPESRINRIREINLRGFKNWFKLICSIAFVLTTYFLLKFYDFQLNPKNWNNSLKFDWGAFLSFILFLISSSVIGFSIAKTLYNSKINKVSIKGEVGLSEGTENKDFLNKYIDEILYFFEKNHIDIVVIEDLDRFNTTEIYRTLREINFILNVYLKNLNSEKKRVVFLYAIKDDIFLNELDRTKFFDLIIPTMPFVNFSNSKNVLNSKLDEIFKDDKSNKPSKDFINTASSFITDNRTLLNILNEFIVYREQQTIQSEELNPEKLLALIMYKNLRPKDFAKFHEGNSLIDIAFSCKEKFISKTIFNHNKKIADIQQEINVVRNHNLGIVNELNTIYLYHIKESLNDNNSRGLIYKGERKSFQNIINESLDLNIYNSEKIKYYGIYGEDTSNIKLKDIDNILGFRYSDRYNMIINKNHIIEDHEADILKLRSEIIKLESESLANIYTSDSNSESFIELWDEIYSKKDINYTSKIYEDAFTIVFLKNGYINEDYREYITIFQKGGLNEKDHEFKINVLSKIRDPKELDYALTNIDDLIEDIPLIYFEDDRILNLKLIDWIFKHREEYPEQVKAILNLTIKWSERTQQLILRFINSADYCKEIFITDLSHNWKEMWLTILNTNFIENDCKKFLILLLENVDNNTLIAMNIDNCLTDFISERADILFDYNFEDKKSQIKMKLFTNGLNVKFKDLSVLVEKYETLLQFIYENDGYELSYDNLGTLLKNRSEHFSSEHFDNKNFSYVLESKLENLINYIEHNYELYLDNIYDKLGDQYDEEKYILKVIDNEDLQLSERLKFIEKQQNKIQDLYKLGDIEFYKLVFIYDKIKSDWENVYKYYFENDKNFDDVITEFLNVEENFLQLSSSKITDSIVEEERDVFITTLLSNNKLTIDAYKELLRSLTTDYKISELDYTLIDKNKVKELINNNVVPLDNSNFESIKDAHPDLHITLLLRDWVDYIEYYKGNPIDVIDKRKILQSQTLNESLKCSVIKNHITSDDLMDSELAQSVVNILLGNNSQIQYVEDALDVDKLKALIDHNIKTELKVKLMYTYQHILNRRIIIELRKKLSKPYSDIFPQTQLIFEDNLHNREFINMLQSMEIAGKGNSSKGKIRVWFKNFKMI